MTLEILGVGVIVPALAIFIEIEDLSSLPLLGPFSNYIESNSRERLILVGTLSLVFIYFFKSCFLSFLAWRKASLVYEIQASMSSRLYNLYLNQPYIFHLEQNSAFLIRNALHEVNSLTNGNSAILILISESLVLVGLTALLVYIEPFGALITIVLVIFCGWAFHIVTKNRLADWGQKRLEHDGNRMKQLQQGFGAIKELKLLNKENEFVIEYDQYNLGSAQLRKRQDALLQLPRFWLEFLAVVGLSVVIMLMILAGDDIALIVPTLGLFAVAGFRLIPSLSRIIGSLQTIRFTTPVIETLYREFSSLSSSLQNTQEAKNQSAKIIRISNLSFTYPGKEEPALSDINIEIRSGTIVGIMGASGAGKSTLINILLGLLPPTTGGIYLDSNNISNSILSWQKNIGYVPQAIFLIDDTIKRNIALGVSEAEIDYESLSYAIDSAQLADFVNEQKHGLSAVIGERGVRISGGQIQRIGIARALYRRPAVLVFDEATSALDRKTEYDFLKTINRLKGDVTIIIISHKLSSLEICDVIFELKNGRLVQESSFERMAKSSNAEASNTSTPNI